MNSTEIIPEDKNEMLFSKDIHNDSAFSDDDDKGIKTTVINRSWLNRTFGPIETGAQRTAIFTLINTAVGVGMLALSKSIASYGYIPGIIMLFIGASNLYIGLYCFRYLMFKYPRAGIYSELVGQVLGRRSEKMLNWIFLIYVWGSLIAYVLVCKLKSIYIVCTLNAALHRIMVRYR